MIARRSGEMRDLILSLLDEPERALELQRQEAVRLLAQVGALAEVLRLAAAAQATTDEASEVAEGGMLRPEEAARLAGLTVEQFYRRKAFRPAIVRAGHRTLRVDERKLRRILAGMGSAH